MECKLEPGRHQPIPEFARLLTLMQIDGGLIRPRELAATLGISRSTLFAWIAAGRIPPGLKFGRSVRVWPRAALPDIVAALAKERGNV